MPQISSNLTALFAVRKFLVDITEDYGEVFVETSKAGKEIWAKVVKEFDSKCAYCRKETKLQKEHLVGANRQECGLQLIGNIVPCCQSCNIRKTIGKEQVDWKKQLKEMCAKNKVDDTERVRREKRISSHIKKYGYPRIIASQKKLIKTLAQNLYVVTTKRGDEFVKLYNDLKKRKLK